MGNIMVAPLFYNALYGLQATERYINRSSWYKILQYAL